MMSLSQCTLNLFTRESRLVYGRVAYNKSVTPESFCFPAVIFHVKKKKKAFVLVNYSLLRHRTINYEFIIWAIYNNVSELWSGSAATILQNLHHRHHHLSVNMTLQEECSHLETGRLTLSSLSLSLFCPCSLWPFRIILSPPFAAL